MKLPTLKPSNMRSRALRYFYDEWKENGMHPHWSSTGLTVAYFKHRAEEDGLKTEVYESVSSGLHLFWIKGVSPQE